MAQPPAMPVPPDQTWRMEAFAKAYVMAVASAAGCSTVIPENDLDSIDITLFRRSPTSANRRPTLDMQLKTTAKRRMPSSPAFSHVLSIKNYDDLRATNVSSPRILLVVVVPPSVDRWVKHSDTQLLLRRCAYWTSLHNAPAVATQSRTVYLQRTQVFDVATLNDIFTSIENGAMPQ